MGCMGWVMVSEGSTMGFSRVEFGGNGGQGSRSFWDISWTCVVSSPSLSYSEIQGDQLTPSSIWGLNRLVYLYFTRQRNVEGELLLSLSRSLDKEFMLIS